MKNILAFGFALCLAFGNGFASGDALPDHSVSTSNFDYTVVYAREWEYASGARNDGPMLVVTLSSPLISLYFTGTPDLLKMYAGTLLSAKSMGKSVTISYGQKWCRYKNVLDDADYTIDGFLNGYKILQITTN